MSYDNYILNQADKHMESHYCDCGLDECQCHSECPECGGTDGKHRRGCK